MTKKMTKKEMFAMVLEVVNKAEVENKEEMVTFLNRELELLNKKSSSTNDKKKEANAILTTQLEEAFKEMTKPVTVTEFMKLSTHEIASLSNQKLSYLLNAMAKEENPRIVKTVEKKVSYFSLA